VSDPNGSLNYTVKHQISKYRQSPDDQAEFLLCPACGVLAGVTYENFSAVNASIIVASFGPRIRVSPKTLSPQEKSNRWKSVWFQNFTLQTRPIKKTPAAVTATEVPPRTKPSNYPEPYKSRMSNRVKTQLGDVFGIQNFGVNMTRLLPGGESALFHKHTKQDEFVFILEGEATLINDDGEHKLTPGMCAGFVANGQGHQLINNSDKDVLYLEVGDRTPGDEGIYPRDDLRAVLAKDGSWRFTRKDGTAF
jgi:uncharacterized cupin superfamily protein